MPLGGWLTAGALGAQAAGGIAGYFAGKDEEEQAAALREKQLRDIDSIPIPKEQKLQLKRLALAGMLTPEMEQEILAGASSMEGVRQSVDPRLKEAQMQALRKLQQIGAEGLTPVDKLALGELRRTVASDEESRRQSALQNLAQRGIAGGGAEIALQAAGSQAASERASQEADRIAAMAYQRSLQAISEAGGLGGRVREQEFGERSKEAEARDIAKRFDVSNRVGTQMRNIAARNAAQEANLRAKQEIENRNVGLTNEEINYNLNAEQREFDNNMRKEAAKRGVTDTVASGLQGEAQAQRSLYGGLGQAGATGLSAYGAYSQGQSGLSQKERELKMKYGKDYIPG